MKLLLDALTVLAVVIGFVWLLDRIVFGLHAPGLFA